VCPVTSRLARTAATRISSKFDVFGRGPSGLTPTPRGRPVGAKTARRSVFTSLPDAILCAPQMTPPARPPLHLASLETQSTILVVDDDARIRRLAARVLNNAGYAILEADDIEVADRLAHEHAPDLVLLDLRLPCGSGDELLRRWRANGQSTAVVILTGDADSEHEAALLEAGADDYIAKPFDLRVLVARVGSVLRRVQRTSPPDGTIELGGVRLVVADCAVEVEGRHASLTRTETRLLRQLMLNAGTVVSYEDLVGAVWGSAFAGQVEMVHTNVYRLRRKLEKDPSRRRWLHAVPRVGYRFEAFDISAAHRLAR
jgi:DNA-binding response OmpR family regulator